MPSTGRPLSLSTIKTALAAVATDLPKGDPARDMCEAISVHLGQKNFMTSETLHQVVIDLDRFTKDYATFLGESTTKHLNKCVDSIARMELRAAHSESFEPSTKLARKVGPTKKLAPKPVTAMGKLARKNEEAKAMHRLRQATTSEAIVGAIKVLLDEVIDGHDDIDTFDSMRHLINVLERLA